MRVLFLALFVCLVFCLSSCTTATKDQKHKPATQQQDEPLPKDSATLPDYVYSNYPELEVYSKNIISFSIVSGDKDHLVVDVSKFFGKIGSSLHHHFTIKAGDDIGAVESISMASGRNIDLDFSTGFKVETIWVQQSLIQEQYLETVDDPAWTVEHSEGSRDRIRVKTSRIIKYRNVYKPQVVGIVVDSSNGKKYKLIQKLQ